jgi:hypothetical protein
MGIRSKWRAGHMKDPVSGVFRVADWYDAHPHSSPPGMTLTGVIVADGLAPTPAEARADHQGKWVGQTELPVTVDRADPANFRIEWEQVVVNDWQSTARHRADEAAARLAAGDQPQQAFGGPGMSVTMGGLGGDLSSVVEQAMRSAGIDPTVMHVGPNSTVHIERTFGTGTPDQAQAMMAGFFGGPAGQQATGVVRAVHDVAAQQQLPPGMSQADLSLDIERPDGSTYPVTTRLGFRSPERRAAIAIIGNRLPVLVDQNDPGRVTVDVARLNLP